ncbi:MAG: flagellar type III secretion system pore protein FliP [Alphaproteobacteria bacterium]|nr:flagellar type III secretion system pore protein FliP [Alphaproteobacteria bacterium]
MSRSLRLLGTILGAVLAVTFAGAAPAGAESFTLELGQGNSATGRILQLVALLTVLSLAPSILIMVTSFTRIVVVLSFLRSAMGLQQTPPNSVLVSLALFLTAFIMAPVVEEAYKAGVAPLIKQEISQEEAFKRTVKPIRTFMLAHVRKNDLALFIDLADVKPATADDTPLRALVPAFMISELRRAFEIGFLLFVPFLVIDMVVASILMSMGMLMLPPVTISLPFKLIFFVLVDGWFLVAGSLVRSFGGG